MLGSVMLEEGHWSSDTQEQKQEGAGPRKFLKMCFFSPFNQDEKMLLVSRRQAGEGVWPVWQQEADDDVGVREETLRIMGRVRQMTSIQMSKIK